MFRRCVDRVQRRRLTIGTHPSLTSRTRTPVTDHRPTASNASGSVHPARMSAQLKHRLFSSNKPKRQCFANTFYPTIPAYWALHGCWKCPRLGVLADWVTQSHVRVNQSNRFRYSPTPSVPRWTVRGTSHESSPTSNFTRSMRSVRCSSGSGPVSESEATTASNGA